MGTTGDGRAAGIAGWVVFIAAIVVAGTLVVSAGSAAQSWYPENWDDRVAGIAAKVATLRGLEFEHPVPVTFVPDAEFEKEFEVDEAELTAQETADIEQTAATLRALGLIGGDTNLVDAVETTASSGTLAYYSYEREEIIVRGTKVDAAVRATLAHELVHVRQFERWGILLLPLYFWIAWRLARRGHDGYLDHPFEREADSKGC